MVSVCRRAKVMGVPLVVGALRLTPDRRVERAIASVELFTSVCCFAVSLLAYVIAYVVGGSGREQQTYLNSSGIRMVLCTRPMLGGDSRSLGVSKRRVVRDHRSRSVSFNHSCDRFELANMVRITLLHLALLVKLASSYVDIPCQWKSKTGANFGRRRLSSHPLFSFH